MRENTESATKTNIPTSRNNSKTYGPQNVPLLPSFPLLCFCSIYLCAKKSVFIYFIRSMAKIWCVGGNTDTISLNFVLTHILLIFSQLPRNFSYHSPIIIINLILVFSHQTIPSQQLFNSYVDSAILPSLTLPSPSPGPRDHDLHGVPPACPAAPPRPATDGLKFPRASNLLKSPKFPQISRNPHNFFL